MLPALECLIGAYLGYNDMGERDRHRGTDDGNIGEEHRQADTEAEPGRCSRRLINILTHQRARKLFDIPRIPASNMHLIPGFSGCHRPKTLIVMGHQHKPFQSVRIKVDSAGLLAALLSPVLHPDESSWIGGRTLLAHPSDYHNWLCRTWTMPTPKLRRSILNFHRG